MSTQPNDPHASDKTIDDLDVPAEEADAISGGITFNGSKDDDQAPEGSLNAI